jgi:hypothetical protein
MRAIPWLPFPEELCRRLLELLRQAKGLRRDLPDRQVRHELRNIAQQIQSAVEATYEDADER